MSKVNPIISVKSTIDKIIENKSLDVDTTPSVLKFTRCCICCSPCILYSTIIRIIACPIQCCTNEQTECDPISSCVIDNMFTIKSDKLIAAGYNNTKHRFPYTSSLSEDDKNDIIDYIYAKFIDQSIDMKSKYLVLDYTSSLILMKSNSISINTVYKFIKWYEHNHKIV
jgi:hypothetical protein